MFCFGKKTRFDDEEEETAYLAFNLFSASAESSSAFWEFLARTFLARSTGFCLRMPPLLTPLSLRPPGPLRRLGPKLRLPYFFLIILVCVFCGCVHHIRIPKQKEYFVDHNNNDNNKICVWKVERREEMLLLEKNIFFLFENIVFLKLFVSLTGTQTRWEFGGV